METNIKYSEKHDAYYDVDIDAWTEAACTDAGCDFCVGRPDKPSQVQEDIGLNDADNDDL